jgi:hypothetical protein
MFEDNAQKSYAAIPKKARDTAGESVGQMKKEATEEANSNITPFKPRVQKIPNDLIRFSQKSVSYLKKQPDGTTYTLDDIKNSMSQNSWQGDPVDAVTMPDGKLTSVDNTRILAARETQTDVLANVHFYDESLTDPEQIERFTETVKVNGQEEDLVPQTWGQAIGNLILHQGKSFDKSFPYGTDNLPKVSKVTK